MILQIHDSLSLPRCERTLRGGGLLGGRGFGGGHLNFRSGRGVEERGSRMGHYNKAGTRR